MGHVPIKKRTKIEGIRTNEYDLGKKRPQIWRKALQEGHVEKHPQAEPPQSPRGRTVHRRDGGDVGDEWAGDGG